jgi:hypothetical protein
MNKEEVTTTPRGAIRFDIGTIQYWYRKIISTKIDYQTKPIFDAQKLEYF